MKSKTIKNIVVIDDELSVGNLIKRFVEKDGHSAIVCTSSLEALVAARSTRPALIISDVNLQGYDNGIDLCIKIQETTEESIPVIIISGQADNEERARKKGFEFLAKPLKKLKLMPVVESYLN